MQPHPGGAGDASAASRQVGVVLLERLGDGAGLVLAIDRAVVLATRQQASSRLRLPVVEHGLAVGILEVVGVGKALHPVATLAVGGNDAPATGGGLATVGQPHARADVG